jgi:hypothetical protein
VAARRPTDPWTPAERRALDRLDREDRIQAFLDAIRYSSDPFYRAPRRVLRERRAHCFDGAMFAAAALERLGHPPLLLDLRAVRDDDHVIALFRRDGRIGAIAKSNFVGLRYREPVFRNLRELALSYFEDYYNVEGEKTLRSYSLPVRLRALEPLDWRVRDEAMEEIARRLDRARHLPLLPPGAARRLSRMDERSYRAGMLGLDRKGLWRPRA